MIRHPLRKEDAEEKNERRGGIRRKKGRDLRPLVLESRTTDRRTMLEIRSDSKTVVDWVGGHAKLKILVSTMSAAQNVMWKWWCKGVDFRRRADDWAKHFW